MVKFEITNCLLQIHIFTLFISNGDDKKKHNFDEDFYFIIPLFQYINNKQTIFKLFTLCVNKIEY
jgi:hypothetical protein